MSSSSSQPHRSTGRHRQPATAATARGSAAATRGTAVTARGTAASAPRQETTPGTRPTDSHRSVQRNATLGMFGAEGELTLSSERREMQCSIIGLGVKFGLVAVAAVSLFRLSAAYQQRMDRQGEIAAVLELETAKLIKSRERFDQLFTQSGEQQLIREQSQWIAPNRLRVVWQPGLAYPTVETANARPGKPQARPGKPQARP